MRALYLLKKNATKCSQAERGQAPAVLASRCSCCGLGLSVGPVPVASALHAGAATTQHANRASRNCASPLTWRFDIRGRPLATASTPSAPMLFASRFSFCKRVMRARYGANDCAPSAPMSLAARSSTCRAEKDASSGTKALAPVLPKPFADRSRVCNADTAISMECSCKG